MISFFNISKFVMRVKGKENNVNEFLSLFQYKHPKKLGFYNLNNIQEDLNSRTIKDNVVKTTIVGECSGSFEVCTFDSPGSHYRNYKSLPKIHFVPTEILKETRRLNIKVEIYSDNLVDFTTEYFYIEKGVLLEKKIYVDGEEVNENYDPIENEEVDIYVPDYDFKF